MIMNSSPDIDDDFPNTTLLSDEDIAAILSSTTTMFVENNNNGGVKGERRSVMEEEEEEKQQQPVIRKRSRASKHTPSTFLIAKPCDFRALVQQLTGCQSADSSYKGPINLNFGAAEEHHDDYTAANRSDTPMLAFTFDQNSTQVNKKKKISDNHDHPCQDNGQQRLLYYEEQESSSNSNNSSNNISSSLSINNGTCENKSDNYSMIIKNNYDDSNNSNNDDDWLLSMNRDIFIQEYSSLEYGSDQYSSPAIAAETDYVASNDDGYCYSLDYIFPDDDSTVLFCGY